MGKFWLTYFAVFLIPVIPSFLLRSNFEKVNAAYQQQKDELSVDISEALKFPDVLWLDARSESKYADSHVTEAVHISFADWEGSLAKIFEKYSDDQVIIVYCNEECSTSKNMAKQLRQELGSEQIYYLIGGFSAWQSR